MCLAVPGKVLEATDVGISRIAKVEFGGVTRQVYLDFVPEVQPGDYVLVHVGFAISRLEPEEADRTLDLLRQLEEETPQQEMPPEVISQEMPPREPR
jgi:hydrogenase expression/formation protein HypC